MFAANLLVNAMRCTYRTLAESTHGRIGLYGEMASCLESPDAHHTVVFEYGNITQWLAYDELVQLEWNVRHIDPNAYFDVQRHTANLKFFYELPRQGLSASVRGIYRSRYGFADSNGNLILDTDSEYVSGYMTWHLTAAKTIRQLTLQAGVDNLTGYTNPQYIPTLAGRLWYTSLRWTWQQRAAPQSNIL